jgi:hypothetical protein
MTMRVDRGRKQSNRVVYEHIQKRWRKTRTKHFHHKGIHGTKTQKRHMPEPLSPKKELRSKHEKT